jgi:UTP-glucose-1-phosphate uridylyltransferase
MKPIRKAVFPLGGWYAMVCTAPVIGHELFAMLLTNDLILGESPVLA